MYRQYVQSGIAPGANTVTTSAIAANTIQPWQLSSSLLNPTVNSFTGDGTTTSFTLTSAPASANTVVVTVNGITQSPVTNYSTNNTSLIFTSAPANASVIRAVQQAMIGTSIVPIDGSVTTSKLGSSLTLSGNTSFSGAISGTSATLSGTLGVTGVTTLTAQPILSSLTASSAVATDASKGLVSVTNTGSGNNVLATSPTLVAPALGTPSSGVMTNVTGLPLTTGVTGTLPVANGGTGVTSSTGTGNNVLSASPTLTGTVAAASLSLSSLTSGRVPYSTTAGLLTDSASLTFDGTNLATTGYASAVGLRSLTGGGIRFNNAGNTNFSFITAPAGTGDMQFDTGAGEGMRLTSTGLGIGTSSPSYDLQVSKTVVSGSVITNINNPSATGSARLYLGNDAGESSAYFQVFGSSHAVKPSIINIGGNANYPLVFDTNGTERMRITAAGNVGIGTSTPDVFSRGYGTILAVSNTGVNGTSIAINSGTSTYPALELGRGGVRTAFLTSQSTVMEFGSIEATPLAFFTNSAERMRIDSSGNLLVGTTSVPTGVSQRVLQVTNGTNGIVVLGSGATLSPNPRIFGGDTYDLGLATGVTTGKMLFYTNDTERMRLPAAGGVQAKTTISVGDATPSASGAGITFPATQSASSDANTLDDYEEGTWTPAIAGDGTTFAGTSYLGRAGKYVKVGDVVWVSFDVEINGVGTQAGNASISGLPFAIPNSSDLSNGGGGLTYMVNMQTNYVYQSCYPQNNSSYLFMIGRTAASTSTTIVASTSFFANAGRIVGWAWYRVTV